MDAGKERGEKVDEKGAFDKDCNSGEEIDGEFTAGQDV